MKPLLGSGVFNADGESRSFIILTLLLSCPIGLVGKFHRNVSRKFFVKERAQHFDNFNRHAEIAIYLVIEKAESGMAFDFQVRPFFLSPS